RDLTTTIDNRYNGSIVSHHGYISDALGRRTSEVRSGPGFYYGDTFRLYSYNDRSELTASNRYAGTNISDLSHPDPKQQYNFGFDPIGNRTTYAGDGVEGAKTYVTNTVNQYTATHSPEEAFAYDL